MIFLTRSKAKQSQAKPSKAKQSQAKLSNAKQSQAIVFVVKCNCVCTRSIKPSKAKQSQAKPALFMDFKREFIGKALCLL